MNASVWDQTVSTSEMTPNKLLTLKQLAHQACIENGASLRLTGSGTRRYCGAVACTVRVSSR